MLSETTRDALPVFPLPNVVLMPGEALPLVVFEPRYRDLLETVMEGDRLMGMATLRGDSGAIHDAVGVGRVMRVDTDEDGRSNIVVVHLTTVQVHDECEQVETFRRFRTTEMPTAEPATRDVEACRSLLYQLAATTAGLSPEAVRITELTGMELIHAVARRLYQDPVNRLQYLRWTDADRASAVCAELAALLSIRPAVGEA